MVDITLSIMINAATHDLSHDLDKQARRYQNGDIIGIRDTAPWATFDKGVWKWNNPISNNREALVHITGLSASNAKNFRMFEEILAASDIIRRRQFKVVLPAENQIELDADKETTWNMPEGKTGALDEIDIIYKKSVVDSKDASKDTLAKSKNGDFR